MVLEHLRGFVPRSPVVRVVLLLAVAGVAIGVAGALLSGGETAATDPSTQAAAPPADTAAASQPAVTGDNAAAPDDPHRRHAHCHLTRRRPNRRRRNGHNRGEHGQRRTGDVERACGRHAACRRLRPVGCRHSSPVGARGDRRQRTGCHDTRRRPGRGRRNGHNRRIHDHSLCCPGNNGATHRATAATDRRAGTRACPPTTATTSPAGSTPTGTASTPATKSCSRRRPRSR